MNEREGVKRAAQSMGGRVVERDGGMVQTGDKRDKRQGRRKEGVERRGKKKSDIRGEV